MKEHDLSFSIQELTTQLLKEKQVETPVIHRFAPGIYIREAYMPAGSIIIGRTHTDEHMNVMLKGKLLLLKEDGDTVELVAPTCFVGSAGRKVAYIVEDVVWQNIYATDETDVETIEATIFGKEEVELPALPMDDVLMLSYAGDNEDFVLAVEEFGFTVPQVEEIAFADNDVIPFPQGAYKVVVADSLIHGKGLLASFPIESGEVIAPLLIDDKRTPAGRYTNHSRKPNAEAVKGTDGNYYLVALKNIRGSTGAYLGEEITLDYRQVLSLRGYRRV